uniref:Uncharacterized protein n=1 Tax=Arundo donax TaxID=35708 RepID=A0A0A9DT69_ARUDO
MAGATTISSSVPRLSLPASAATSAICCAASAASDDASAEKKAPAIAAAAGDDTARPPFLAALRSRLRREMLGTLLLPLVDGADRARILVGLSMAIVAMVAIDSASLRLSTLSAFLREQRWQWQLLAGKV